jgi:gas vesicle protein
MTDPDRIRQEIEQTQGRLSHDVDMLAEKVTPSRIVERRVGRVRAAAGRWKETVMGAVPHPTHSSSVTTGTHSSGGPGLAGQAQQAVQQVGGQVSGVAHQVGDQASGLASSAADAVAHAPQAVRRQAQGNPLAAGLVAFGAGWLVASLLPASQRERELAEQAQQRAQELAAPLADKAKEVVSDLQQPAQQAVQQVRETAQGAVQTVTETGRSAAGQVQERAQEAPQNVRENIR